MTDLFHKAARDGYLDLLREATRRDSNRPDEDGMTPTLWASFCGNLDALRMLVTRGGNPDKCDYFGSTCLHHAAANGHMSCVSFLVSFGANLWALDNEFHTALDTAALNDRTEIVKYMDAVLARQAALNKKVVKKLREKSVLDAEKRVKKYNKMLTKAQKKAEKEDKKIARSWEKRVDATEFEIVTPGESILRQNETKSNSVVTIGAKKGTIGSSFSQPKPYSEHFSHNTHSTRKPILGGVAKKIKQKRHQDTNGGADFKILETESDGKKTVKSLSGLQRDSQIMYVRNGEASSSKGAHRMPLEDVFGSTAEDALSRAISEPDFNYSGDSGVDSFDSNNSAKNESSSMFERPGFGSVAFFNRPSTSGALMSLPNNVTEEETLQNGQDSNHEKPRSSYKISRSASISDSIGTLGSLAVRMKALPWSDEELETLDDDVIDEGSPLELFLAAHNLTDFISVFTREKIDLSALMLCTDDDLKDIGVPMGPRRKIMDAVMRRRKFIDKPGVVMDSVL